MRWRHLKKNELDHELLWLCVSVSTFLMAAIWLHFNGPAPACAFHHFTGWPCLTCGCTRCLRHLLTAQWSAAFCINPLAALIALFVLIYDLYAAAVILARRPRLRWDSMSPRSANCLRFSAVAIAALNWSWLIYKGA